jgi:putative redox protein
MNEPAVRIRLIDKMQFQAETPSGFTLRLDSSPDGGGEDAGMRPMEAQLIALGSCGAMDVISMLRKMRQDVTTYEVALTHVRATEHPRVYTKILITHRVTGNDIREANVRRAIGLSMERYCPVYAMLSPTVDINERFSITDEVSGAVVEGDVRLVDGKAPPSA